MAKGLNHIRLSDKDKRVLKGMGKLAGDLGSRSFYHSDTIRRVRRRSMTQMIRHAVFMMRIATFEKRSER